MKTINVLGIDLAKNIFHIYGVDQQGKKIVSKQLRRRDLLINVLQLNPQRVAMEACSGSHYWARLFRSHNIEAKIIAGQFVKPFVKSVKNDALDAEAICEAAQRPNMRFVPLKEVRHQDIQCIHRAREQLVKRRTALINEIRGLLSEYGVMIPQGPSYVTKMLPKILEDSDERLTSLFKRILRKLSVDLKYFEESLKEYEVMITEVYKETKVCQNLGKISGVGKITATAVYAAAGNPNEFKNGRHFAAWLGLVPRQMSSGGKERLLGITKRGDKYIRKLLVQGASSFLIHAHRSEESKAKWAMKMLERKERNKVTIAIANKNARLIWHGLMEGSKS